MDRASELARRYGGLALLAITFVVVMARTMVYTDTDTFTLLAAGRSLIADGHFPDPLLYSFLPEAGDFYHYYWLFAALAHLSESLAGFGGLLFFKAVLVTATAYVVMRLLAGGDDLKELGLMALVVAFLITFALTDRGVSVRATYISFLFIPLLVYVLTYRRNWFPVLPVITIAWVNLHGIEWIVGAAICGAWGVQHLYRHVVEGEVLDWRAIAWVVSCLPATLVNPAGPMLLIAPFIPAADGHHFIRELGSAGFAQWVDFSAGLTNRNAATLVVLITVGGMLSQHWTVWRNHLDAVLLMLAGCALLLMGNRFMWEWLLLSVPFIALALRGYAVDRRQVMVAAVVFLLVGHGWLQRVTPTLGEWPFDEQSLPVATTSFVASLPGTKRYAVAPTFAGYVSWKAGPDVLVHTDMQTPPYGPAEYFDILRAELSPQAMSHFLASHAPDVLGIPRSSPFRGHPGLVPVHFDQHLVVYLNRSARPDLAARYALRTLNPHHPEMLAAEALAEGIAELRTMLGVVPGNSAARLLLTGFLIARGDLAAAKSELEILAVSVPDNDSLISYRAQIAQGEGRYADAADLYARLYGRGIDPGITGALLAESLFLAGDLKRAFDVYSDVLNPYRDRNFDWEDYYRYAISAASVGEVATARKLEGMLTIMRTSDAQAEQLQVLSNMLEDGAD